MKSLTEISCSFGNLSWLNPHFVLKASLAFWYLFQQILKDTCLFKLKSSYLKTKPKHKKTPDTLYSHVWNASLIWGLCLMLSFVHPIKNWTKRVPSLGDAVLFSIADLFCVKSFPHETRERCIVYVFWICVSESSTY